MNFSKKKSFIALSYCFSKQSNIKENAMENIRSQYTILKQVCELIPAYIVPKLAREYGIEKKCRTFDSWSHVLALIHAQLAHSISLNDVCDASNNHSGVLTTIRKATCPSRNGLSYANMHRNADMAEALFWNVLESLQKQCPKFGYRHGYCGLPKKFKRTINAIDSTTIKLFVSCIGWAKHRRHKAGIKCHVSLNLQTFLPNIIIIREAKNHDSTYARELCTHLHDGEIVVWDKAYNDFRHLNELNKRGIFWVNRAKDNMTYNVVRKVSEPKNKVLRDVAIRLNGVQTLLGYPEELRLVESLVEVKGKEVKMTFITNNFEWSANSIMMLYKSRWGIEVFFKEIKQNLQIADFLGHNENAVRWQIWIAMLVYVLLRFIQYEANWNKPFSRLFTLLRGVMWSCLDVFSLVKRYGTADVRLKMCAKVEYAYLPVFSPQILWDSPNLF